MGNNFVKALRGACYSHFKNNMCYVKDSSFRFTPFGMTLLVMQGGKVFRLKPENFTFSPVVIVIPNIVRNL